jgi:hypothetical protein
VADFRECRERRESPVVMILHATCQQTFSALAAVEIDTSLTEDLHRMIEASKTELAALEPELDGAEGSSR